MDKPIARIIDRIDPAAQHLIGMSLDEARQRLLLNDPTAVLGIEGSFALMARDGERVVLARSLDRPLRYFLAKEVSGPMLAVADRIDSLRAVLEEEGYGDQFHPSYTRMVPAHHVTTLRLIGCPDPNPNHRRFFAPPRAVMKDDLEEVGNRYVGALIDAMGRWLEVIPDEEPIGVLFSGGADSGAVLLALYHQIMTTGQSPSRLKAFTLSVGDEHGESVTPSPDLIQARDFLRRTGIEMLGEAIEMPFDAVDPFAAVAVIEDYKPLDVDCAAVGLALAAGIRQRYPDWKWLVDGDGGDENLKDYPIEENPELTIHSVVGNSMLYQEGWGVEAIKHSLTYSGGQSRGCVRTWAPARHHGFLGFSPFTRPPVVAVAEAIPFDQLTAGNHEALYDLKGEVLRRGILRHTGIEMPVYPKRRFQHGAISTAINAKTDTNEAPYRRHFASLYAR